MVWGELTLIALRAPGVDDQLLLSISARGAAKSQYSTSLTPLKRTVSKPSPACALSWLGGAAGLPFSPQDANPIAIAAPRAKAKQAKFLKILTLDLYGIAKTSYCAKIPKGNGQPNHR